MPTGCDTSIVPWKKIFSKELLKCKHCEVLLQKFENPATRKVGDFHVLRCNDCVQVVAETVEGNFLFVEQYRVGSEEISLELPGGIIDDGESPIDAAIRELAEETGYVGHAAGVVAGLRQNPSMQTNINYCVLIRDCEKKVATNFDEFEYLRTLVLSRGDVISAIGSGKIANCVSISCLTRYFLSSGTLRVSA